MVVHEIIRPRITLLLMFLSFSFFLHSQELVVKGTVKDSSVAGSECLCERR